MWSGQGLSGSSIASIYLVQKNIPTKFECGNSAHTHTGTHIPSHNTTFLSDSEQQSTICFEHVSLLRCTIGRTWHKAHIEMNVFMEDSNGSRCPSGK